MECSVFDLSQCFADNVRMLMESVWVCALIVTVVAVEGGVALFHRRFEPGARFSFLPLVFLCVSRRGTMTVWVALLPVAYTIAGALCVYAGMWARKQYRSVERVGGEE